MTRTKYSEGITTNYPLSAEPGTVSLGVYNIHTPMLMQTGRTKPMRGSPNGKRYKALPFELQQILPKTLPSSYEHRAESEELCQAFGPRFPQRFDMAMRHAFEQPLRDLLGPNGKRLFRQMAITWPSSFVEVEIWKTLWHYRAAMKRVVDDGYWAFLPLMLRFSSEQVRWEGSSLLDKEQPVQVMSKALGKGLWKKLCAQSANRKLLMAQRLRQLHGTLTADDLDRYQIPDLLDAWASLPTTMLANSKLACGNVRDLQYMHHLSTLRPWPFKEYKEYNRTLHMWGYVDNALNGNAPLNWSPRRVEQEHRHHVEVANDRYERERTLDAARFKLPFELSLAVPHTHSITSTGHVARLLMSRQEYQDQGSSQRHCVGGYGRDGQDSQCFTYSIEKQDGTILSTIMLGKMGTMVQHYGKFNAVITDPDLLESAHQLVLLASMLLSTEALAKHRPIEVNYPEAIVHDDENEFNF